VIIEYPTSLYPSGNIVGWRLHQQSYSSLSWVSTEMGDCSWVYCLRIQPSYPCQLSLAIHPWAAI